MKFLTTLILGFLLANSALAATASPTANSVTAIVHGGTAASTAQGALDNLSGASGTTTGCLERLENGTWTLYQGSGCGGGGIPNNVFIEEVGLTYFVAENGSTFFVSE